jgi:hypothetical protein
MKHTEFRIGLEFYTTTGAWRCTDVGTRVVTALRLGQPDPKVYEGPPYAIAELVFDENDQDAASLRPQKLVVIGVLEDQSMKYRAAASAEALKHEVDRLRQVCAEAYHIASAAGGPGRLLDALWAASEGKPPQRDSFLPVSSNERSRAESSVSRREALPAERVLAGANR